MDFTVIDIALVKNTRLQIPVILKHLILTTANIVINCRNGVVKLSFQIMTLELNVFNIYK